MATTTYTIDGHRLPLGTDDVIDYLAQFGTVTDHGSQAGTLHCLTLTPRTYVTSTIALTVYLYEGSDPRTPFERALLGTAGVYSAVASTSVRSFVDLADAVTCYLAMTGQADAWWPGVVSLAEEKIA